MFALGKLIGRLLLLGMSPREALRFLLFVGFSLGVHLIAAFLLWLLPLFNWLDDEVPPLTVEIVELAAEDPIPEPEPELEPEPEPEPEEAVVPERQPIAEEPPPPRLRPPPPDAVPDPTPAEPPPAEEAIADFTGETMTNESGDAWNSATGSGAPMEGPVGQPGARVTGRLRHGSREGAVGGRGTDEGERLVPIRDLSRRPGPPSARLQELLRNNYPRDARQMGIEGDARVRVRVQADGRVVPMTVLSEDHEGFGAACRRTIRQGGRWEAPLDRQGNPVATIATFRCSFTFNL